MQVSLSWPAKELYFAGMQSSHANDAREILYLPAGQSTHEIAECVVDLNAPAIHAVTDAPSPVKPASARQSFSAFEPVVVPVPELAGQAVHVSNVCVLAALYLEATHRVHASEDAGEALYVPGGHAETDAPAPVNPASARQSPTASDPVVLPVPELEGQAVQATVEAGVTLNMPAAQAATLEPAPVCPASAKQSTSASDPDGLLLLGGHPVQVSDVCAVAALNFPAEQLVHWEAAA